MSGFSRLHVRSVEANRTIKDELQAAVVRVSQRKNITVTDLVNPRQAFFRRRHPDISPSLDRVQVMWAGSGFHEQFGKAASSEEYVEQYIEWESIVGKIDIYEEVPAELKTTSVHPLDLHQRPSWIDQLGMYCAMTDNDRGNLLVYQRAEFGRTPSLRAYDVTFLDIPGIQTDLRLVRDLFVNALENDDPGLLDRCEWSGRCDYGAVCGCAQLPEASALVGRARCAIAENTELASRLSSLLGEQPAPPGWRLTDLVFPRKALLERTTSKSQSEREQEDEFKSMQRQGFQQALLQSLYYGVRGAFRGQPIALGDLSGVVRLFRDAPTLFRVSHFKEMVERHRLAEAMPHYLDRLAFECALTDLDKGRIVIHLDRLAGAKFMVYDVGFRDLPGIKIEAERRLALLQSGSIDGLPKCPSWMARYCSFAPKCGCS
ncbi:MAG: hypothetical protein WEB00_03190 [Dehalococcoidia bacterium]